MSLLAAYHHVAVALRKASSVVVCAHVGPDGDAIGSTLGLTLALRDAGIPAVPTLADDAPAPSTYEFMPGYALYTAAAELQVPDVFVSLDAPSLSRLGVAEGLARDAETLCVLDHHPDATPFGDVNVLDPATSASGQMVWRLLQPLDVRASPDVALCCYVGLLTDTGRFQFQNTTAASFRDAADMVEAGVDPSEAARLVYQDRTAGAMALEARAMGRVTFANRGRVAWAWIEEGDFDDTGARPEEAESLPDAIRQVGGVDVVALLRVRDGEIRGNLRAKTGVDVASVAREFGGGGHTAAAGFTFEGSLEELLARLLPQLPGGEAA